MANVLPRQKQLGILNALVEGCSVRSTERMLDVSRETVLSLLVRVGEGCAQLMDSTMRDLPCKRLELDEIWAFIGKKQRHIKASEGGSEMGDVWTYVAIDAETKLVPCFRIGKRDGATTDAFVRDLASRLRCRVQLSSDGLRLYINAIDDAFGSDVDYAQIVKKYEADAIGPGRYSPPKVTSTDKTAIMGSPDMGKVSTSYVERQNLTMRMSMRRFTRLTNAHSKTLRNHKAATALHFAHYNFVRQHSTIRTTPAMAIGIAPTMWSMDELLDAALHGVMP